MNSDSFVNTQSTAILLLIFNRPEKTKKLYEVISNLAPSKLYIAADGPREGNSLDFELCRRTREIFSEIPWECTVKTLFRENNLGCKEAVSSAINWFFSHENEGVILEDDCIPHPSFFRFCSELLEKYRDDNRIMMISGNNFLFSQYEPSKSYYFSLQTHIWGWATWKRAWNCYDVNMLKWPEFRDNKFLRGLYWDGNIIGQWIKVMDKTYKNEIKTWDYQWQFTCWAHSGLSIMPSKNLVSNIGDDAEGTHVNPSKPESSIQPQYEMFFPLNHPDFYLRDFKADTITMKRIFPPRGWKISIIEKIKSHINDLVG